MVIRVYMFIFWVFDRIGFSLRFGIIETDIFNVEYFVGSEVFFSIWM